MLTVIMAITLGAARLNALAAMLGLDVLVAFTSEKTILQYTLPDVRLLKWKGARTWQ